MSTSRFLLIALLALPIATAAEEKKDWPKQPDAQVLEQVQSIKRTGFEIHRRQQLHAQALEALSREVGRRKSKASASWILHEDGASRRVALVRADRRAGLTWFADVELRDDGPATVSTKPPRELTAAERDTLAAIEVAREAGRNACSKEFEAVVVPVDGGDLDVFVLATSRKEYELVFGGHARVRVAPGGSTVREIERYSKSCLVMDLGNPSLVSLMATHIVSDLPAPTHIVASLVQPRPIYLATKSYLWNITKGEVQAVDP